MKTLPLNYINYIKETKQQRIIVDNDFDIEIIQRFSKPFPNQEGANVLPTARIIPKTNWGKMMWCEEHQCLTGDNFCCGICEGE